MSSALKAARNEASSSSRGERGEAVVVSRVRRIAVVDEFDVHGARAEQRDELVEGSGCGIRPTIGQRATDSALAASGEHRPFRSAASAGESVEAFLAAGEGRELLEVIVRAPLLGPLQLGAGEGGGEPVRGTGGDCMLHPPSLPPPPTPRGCGTRNGTQ